MNKQKLYIIIISVVGMLSALMPWMYTNALGVRLYTTSGTEGYGKFSLIIFGVILGLCFIGNKTGKLVNNAIYSIWGLSVINVVIFSLWMNQIVNSYVLSAGHGVYVMLFATVGVVLLSIDNLKLVEKLETLMKNKK